MLRSPWSHRAAPWDKIFKGPSQVGPAVWIYICSYLLGTYVYIFTCVRACTSSGLIHLILSKLHNLTQPKIIWPVEESRSPCLLHEVVRFWGQNQHDQCYKSFWFSLFISISKNVCKTKYIQFASGFLLRLIKWNIWSVYQYAKLTLTNLTCAVCCTDNKMSKDEERQFITEEDGSNGVCWMQSQTMDNEEDEALTNKHNDRKITTLDDLISNIKFGSLHLKMLITTGGAYFAVCAEIVVVVFLSDLVKKEWNLDKFIFSLLPLGSGIGGILGECTFGIFSDKFGRKWPFAIAVSLVALFGIASAFAPSFMVLVVLRSCVSVGNGAVSSIVFVYLLGTLPILYEHWDIAKSQL